MTEDEIEKLRASRDEAYERVAAAEHRVRRLAAELFIAGDELKRLHSSVNHHATHGCERCRKLLDELEEEKRG